jgi:hypothetical protein
MIRYWTVLVIAFLGLLAMPSAFARADEGVIGTIVEVEGSVSLASSGAQPVTATVNMPVHLNDVVQTGIASRAFILFIDNTELTLSENAVVTVNSYVYNPDDNTNNQASYSVVQGAFNYVSGLIGKKDNPDVHIDTPVGSIGIRGTDFWAGNLDNQYSVAVNEGQVALKTDAGEEVVNKGQGTAVKDRHSIPSHAEMWAPEKFRRIADTVHLQHAALVRQRIKAMQGRQVLLRNHYKNYMARHGNVSGRGGQEQARSRHAQDRSQAQNNSNAADNMKNRKQQRRAAWCKHHPKKCAQRQKEKKDN